MSYTLRGRLETRLAAALLPFLVAAVLVADPARLVAARARRADARDRPRARRRALPPPAPLPARLARAPARAARARPDDGRRAAARAERRRSGRRSRSSPAPGSCSRCSRTPGCRCCGSAGPRTAASSAVPASILAAAAPVGAARGRRHGVGGRAADRPARGRRCTRARSSSTTRRRSSASREPIVRGGILITADDVTVRNVTVRGGEYGIEVDGRGQRRAGGRRRRGRRARRDQRPPQPGRDPRLHDPLAAGGLHAGDRHLVRLRPPAEPRRALHGRSAGSRGSSPTSRW